MKSNIKAVFSFLILGLGAYYLSTKSEQLSPLKDLTLSQIMIFSAAILVTYHINSMKFGTLFSSFNIRLSLKESWGLIQVKRMANLIFFKSGSVANAYYLKKNHGLSYTEYVTAIICDHIVDLFTYTWTGLMLSSSLYLIGKTEIYLVWIFVVLLGAISFILFFSSFQIPDNDSRVIQKIKSVLTLWNGFKSNTLVIIKISLLEALKIIVFGLRLFIAFGILNQDVSPYECLLMSLVVSLGEIVNFTPDGLGLREVFVGLSAMYLSLSFDYGIIATALDRVLSTAWFCLLGFIFLHMLQLKEYQGYQGPISEIK